MVLHFKTTSLVVFWSLYLFDRIGFEKASSFKGCYILKQHLWLYFDLLYLLDRIGFEKASSFKRVSHTTDWTWTVLLTVMNRTPGHSVKKSPCAKPPPRNTWLHPLNNLLKSSSWLTFLCPRLAMVFHVICACSLQTWPWELCFPTWQRFVSCWYI